MKHKHFDYSTDIRVFEFGSLEELNYLRDVGSRSWNLVAVMSTGSYDNIQGGVIKVYYWEKELE